MFALQSISFQDLKSLLQAKAPFSYDLGVTIIPSRQKDAGVMICCHGYGANKQIAQSVAQSNAITDHIIGFNFPDYECINKGYDPLMSSFGTIQELLPLFYLMKKCVIDGHLDVLNLYGFSAGGAAVINAIAVLNKSTYDADLAKIGIDPEQKKKIVAAVQKGIIILDCPLKSMEEIMAVRGKSPEFEIIAKRYVENNMRPIDAITNLNSLHILLHFQKPDEVLSNRDDEIFIEKLKKANNKGITQIVIGSEGGHNTFHASLWKAYKNFKKNL